MSASRGTAQMGGAVPGKPGTAGNGDVAHHGGQYPAGQVRVRDLLGDEVLDALVERSKDENGGLRLTGGVHSGVLGVDDHVIWLWR
jgi:hypothetical protein